MQNILCKKAFTAIEAVLYIACTSGAEPVRSKEICEYQGVALRYLEHILRKLVHDGILRGVRGPKGGYFLARERRKITLGEIYKAIEELENEGDTGQAYSPLYSKVIAPIKHDLRAEAILKMEQITLQDLYEQAIAKLGEDNFAKKSDFSI